MLAALFSNHGYVAYGNFDDGTFREARALEWSKARPTFVLHQPTMLNLLAANRRFLEAYFDIPESLPRHELIPRFLQTYSRADSPAQYMLIDIAFGTPYYNHNVYVQRDVLDNLDLQQTPELQSVVMGQVGQYVMS